jgi:integrase
MSNLREALEAYLAVRRSLGFSLRGTGRLLHSFVSFLEQQGIACVTTEIALRWAKQPNDVQPAQWARRLSMIRLFAQYHSATDPRTEVPPQGLLPYRYHRKPPYIYSDREIAQLLQAAKRLPSTRGLRPETYSTLFGLLAVTGLRISEALGLDRDDVDLTEDVLTVRQTKCRKTHLVPIHPSTRRRLQEYARKRDQVHPQPNTPSFFLSDQGTRVSEWAVRWAFVGVSRQIGLRGPSDSRGPRLHDLRHRFAVRTLLGWYRAGVDVERHLPELATYLGHSHVTDTYWYLTGTPELLRLAATRLDQPKGDRLR